jgi:hypothetical protein
MIVLVADHDQRRHLHLLEPVFEIVERRSARLYAAHGVGRAAIGMGSEAIGELLPAMRVLVLELNPTCAQRIDLREFPGALLLEIVRDFQGDAAKILLVLLLAAIAGTGDRERVRALRRAQPEMHGAKAPHREPDDVGLVDPEPVEHGNGIGGGQRLRIGVDARGHIRRRIAARGIGDAAMAAAEIANLRFPARVVAAEFMDEEDRRACTGLFHIELHAVAGGDHRHRKIPFRIATAVR